MRQRVRARALVLLLTLIGGAFGLPLLDALAFHSGAQATEVGAPDQIGVAQTTGIAHALGCAVWATAASGTGLPGLPQARAALQSSAPECGHKPPVLLHTQTDLALGLSRAPPRS